MERADERIAVTERAKAALERRRQEGESYNDVLHRLLSPQHDAAFEDGFGLLSTDEAAILRKRRDVAKSERKSRGDYNHLDE